MNSDTADKILQRLGAQSITNKEVIQELWSGYGEILRLEIDHGTRPSVVLKLIDLTGQDAHPRGWNTNLSHQRKLKSYQVESFWYSDWVKENNFKFKIPSCLFTDSNDRQQLILLDDLNYEGFPVRRDSLNFSEIKVVLKWLAQFHGEFYNQKPVGLWEEGSYWHLGTRPDEWNDMTSGSLKNAAQVISDRLKNAKHQTIIHGDAKLANFCFSDDSKQVAAVDFQYVGGGCGMKDVAYFVGSCMSEKQLEQHESEILNFYFTELSNSVSIPINDFLELEEEWRELYSWAWADFERFLLGWMPTHAKLNGYSSRMTKRVIRSI